MDREEIETLAVSYAAGELADQELEQFQIWRAAASAEELSWFAAIVDAAAEIAWSANEPITPSTHMKDQLMAKIEPKPETK